MATFGNTSTTHDDHEFGGGDSIYLFKATLSEAGSVASIHFYGQASGGTRNAKGLLYDDDGTGGRAQTRLGVTDPTAVTTTTGWWTFTFATPVVLAAGSYWIGIVPEDDAIPISVNTGGSGSEATYLSQSYASPAASLGAPSAAYTEDMCVYATYTPSGGATSIECQMSDSAANAADSIAGFRTMGFAGSDNLNA